MGEATENEIKFKEKYDSIHIEKKSEKNIFFHSFTIFLASYLQILKMEISSFLGVECDETETEPTKFHMFKLDSNLFPDWSIGTCDINTNELFERKPIVQIGFPHFGEVIAPFKVTFSLFSVSESS